jgi:hypothetical protein
MLGPGYSVGPIMMRFVMDGSAGCLNSQQARPYFPAPIYLITAALTRHERPAHCLRSPPSWTNP